jgi:hypothetical protein
MVPGGAGSAIGLAYRGVKEGVLRLLITRYAAIAGAGETEGGGQAENRHHAEYGSGPEYPARAHSHRARHVKPPFYSAPSVQSALESDLQNLPAIYLARGQPVTVADWHALVRLRQHSDGQLLALTRAEHHIVVAGLVHLMPPTRSWHSRQQCRRRYA